MTPWLEIRQAKTHWYVSMNRPWIVNPGICGFSTKNRWGIQVSESVCVCPMSLPCRQTHDIDWHSTLKLRGNQGARSVTQLVTLSHTHTHTRTHALTYSICITLTHHIDWFSVTSSTKEAWICLNKKNQLDMHRVDKIIRHPWYF